MDWWREMFASEAWQTVQLAWEEADDADETAARVARAVDLAPGSRVLDVPCGTGRIGKRLAAAGYPVTGIDAFVPVLAEARAAGIPVIRADMRTQVVRPFTFDAVLCLWGSFGYFDDEGDRDQAAGAAAALVRGGRFLIDIPVADTLLEVFEPESEWSVGGVDVHEARVYREDTGRIETTWTFTHGNEHDVRTTSVRLYAVVELMELLSDAGFAAFLALNDELDPFRPGEDRLWLVAAVP
jgi:SAM-dependent methyltransferase